MSNDLLVKLIQELVSNKQPTCTNHTRIPFEKGKEYFIRTGTYHVIGRVQEVVGKFLVFEEGTVAWIADSGRFTQCIDNGALNEVEPVKVVGYLNTDFIADAYDWVHELPRKQQ